MLMELWWPQHTAIWWPSGHKPIPPCPEYLLPLHLNLSFFILTISIINKSNNPLPAYKSTGAAGLDIAAFLPQPITLQPLQRQLVPTGLYIAIPVNFEGQMRPRSGTAISRGLTLINSPGTIDADYRGELMLPVINLSNVPVTIETGERLAQLVICPVMVARLQEVQVLPETERGSGGFGSTGVK